VRQKRPTCLNCAARFFVALTARRSLVGEIRTYTVGTFMYTNIMYVTYLSPPRIYVRHVCVRYLSYSIVCLCIKIVPITIIIIYDNTYLVYIILLLRSIILVLCSPIRCSSSPYIVYL